jgi:hypothetical protein
VRVGFGKEVAEFARGRGVDAEVELSATFCGEQAAGDDVGERRVGLQLALVVGRRRRLGEDNFAATVHLDRGGTRDGVDVDDDATRRVIPKVSGQWS